MANEFSDQLRQLIVEKYSHAPEVKSGSNMAIDKIVAAALANQSFINACNTDYTRTYTKGEYTMYDRTQSKTNIEADFPAFSDMQIQKILQGIGGSGGAGH